MDPQIYRSAPEDKIETPPRRTASSVAVIAALVVLTATTLLRGGMSQGRFETHRFAIALTLVGFVAVVAIQRVHAAWKRRHDAKLMIEWERRIEEMK